MTDPSKSDQQISDMISANLSLDPTDQNQSNYKLLNDIYLNYFAGQYSDLPADILATLTAIAQQCYVSGGPSVFQARSMYWIATGSSDLSYTDDCIATTGSFRSKAPANVAIANITQLNIYPNPVSSKSIINIDAIQGGTISFCNILGQKILTSDYVKGNNQLNFTDINIGTGLLFYKTKNNDGTSNEGKLEILK